MLSKENLSLATWLGYYKKKIKTKLPGSRESFSNFDDKFIYNFWKNIEVEFQKKIILSLFSEFNQTLNVD